jgi:predicted membrane-bound mannosyltransferase
VVGAVTAASPLAFWWLDPSTVYALGLALIAAVYIGFAVADGRPKVIVAESTVASIFVVVAAVAVTGSSASSATASKTCGSTAATLWPTPGGGRRFAWSSTGLPRQSSPSRSSPE